MSEIRKKGLISTFWIYIGFAVGALNTFLFARKGFFNPQDYGLSTGNVGGHTGGSGIENVATARAFIERDGNRLRTFQECENGRDGARCRTQCNQSDCARR